MLSRILYVSMNLKFEVNYEKVVEDLSAVLSVIKRESKLCYILGDFNINLLNIDSHLATAEFLETMYAFSYLPLITKPTRVTDHSATLIDNIFTNHKIHSHGFPGIFSTDTSDHFPIFYVDKVITHQHINQFVKKQTFFRM